MATIKMRLTISLAKRGNFMLKICAFKMFLNNNCRSRLTRFTNF